MRACIALFMMALSLSANAHDGLYSNESTTDYDGNNVLTGETVEVVFDVLPPDVGRFGAFYVALRVGSGQVYHVTRNGLSGTSNAYDYFEQTASLPAQKRSVVFQWSGIVPGGNSSICSMLASRGERGAELWVGYGAVQEDIVAAMARPDGVPHPEEVNDHFRLVSSFGDGGTNQKYANVLTLSCFPENRPMNWPTDAPLVSRPAY